MNNKQHPKYPYQRAEQRHNNNINHNSLREQRQMESQSKTKIAIGTFNILPPKPDTEIASFTLAFTTPIPKHELYPTLKQIFGENWNGEPTKSIFIHLEKSIPLSELRKKLRENFNNLLPT